MNTLLRQKIDNFIQFISQTQDSNEINIFVERVESILFNLHKELSKEISNTVPHTLYRTKETWMREEGLNSVKELLAMAIPIS